MASIVWPEHFGNQSYDDPEKPTANVDVVNFGDNYTQRASAGINSVKATLELRFRRKRDLALEMYDWLLPKLNLTPFHCAFPDMTPGNYVCTQVQKSRSGPMDMTITATFEQDFSLGG